MSDAGDARILLIGGDAIDAVDRASSIEDALAKIDARDYAMVIVPDAATALRLRTTERGRSARVVVTSGGDPAPRHGAFISTLAHDLRNPLSAVTTGIELVRLRAPDPDLGKAIDRIASATRRMAAMIDLLSELARATAGKGEPPIRQAADLGELARIAAQQVRTDRKIDVAAAGDVRTSVDPVRVTTAIAGVLEDVVRRGDRGAPIDIRLDGTTADAIAISIEGGAPPAGDVPDLRLYLARHAIEAHGGSLTLDPVERGAIVTIVLPRRTS